MPDDSIEKPKKKRGRPKGSTKKPKTPKDEPKKKESTEVTALTTRTISVESFTNKRGSEVIFRREMGEPEFFLHKNELSPPRPVLSKDEEEEISKKVQIPTDQIPKYEPENILSPEFAGLSNYERGVENHKQELEEKLRRLKANPDDNENQIKLLEDELSSLDYLYENYNIGMNVFRTAKGGRSKLKA